MIEQWLDHVDLSNEIRNGTVIKGRKGRPAVGSKISITLPDDLIIELKKSGEKARDRLSDPDQNERERKY